MKLSEIMKKGYKLRAWAMIKAPNSEDRHIAVKLSKKNVLGKEKYYVVHSPQIETILSDVEFTEPVLLKEGKK